MDYYASKYDEKMKRFKGVVWKRKEDFLLNAAMELYGEFCTETFDKYTSKLDARDPMSPTDMRNFLLKTRKVRASSTNWRWAVGNINTGSDDEIVASALPKEFERNFSGPIEDSVKCSYNRRYYYRPTLNLESGGIDCIVLSFNVYAVVDVKVDFDPNITLHIGRRTILLAEEAITLGRTAFVIGPEELRGTGVSLKKIPICLIRGLLCR